MQIVIDIDDERYKDILRIAEVQLDMRTDTVEQIIAKGTPLPKRIEYGADGNLYEMSITNGKEYEEGNTGAEKAGEKE